MTIKVGILSMNVFASLYIWKVVPFLAPIQVLEPSSEVLSRCNLLNVKSSKISIQILAENNPDTEEFEMALNCEKCIIAITVSCAVFLAIISTVAAQGTSNYYAEKPGSCPPPLPVQICTPGCYVDGHCQGNQKCCSTSCGGTICSIPVTMRRPVPVVKAGSCPAIPTGRWVCTPTCSTDGDCPGIRKCCKNRCGAMACQKPQVDVDEFEGGDGGYVEQPIPNPFLVYMN